MQYKIWQIPPGKTRDYGFLSLDRFKEAVGSKLSSETQYHEMVYESQIEIKDSITNALDVLFTIFNTEHPEDYTGRSVSVGDILEIDSKYYYCDMIGWVQITIEDIDKLDGKKVIIKSNTRTHQPYGINFKPEQVSWAGTVVEVKSDTIAIIPLDINKWFPMDPEIKSVILIFNRSEVEVTKIGE